MRCPLVTPMPSSSLTGPLPTSVPPLRPHHESWLQEDIPSFIPSGQGVIRCQLPELQDEDSSMKPLHLLNKFFLVAPGGEISDQPAQVSPNTSYSTSSSPRVRLRMRPTTTAFHVNEITTPSAFKLPLLSVTNTATKSQKLITRERIDFETSIHALRVPPRPSFPNSSVTEGNVKVADPILPSLADKMIVSNDGDVETTSASLPSAVPKLVKGNALPA